MALDHVLGCSWGHTCLFWMKFSENVVIIPIGICNFLQFLFTCANEPQTHIQIVWKLCCHPVQATAGRKIQLNRERELQNKLKWLLFQFDSGLTILESENWKESTILILEPWITPSIFEEVNLGENKLKIVDEYTYAQYVDKKFAKTRLDRYENWITLCKMNRGCTKFYRILQRCWFLLVKSSHW